MAVEGSEVKYMKVNELSAEVEAEVFGARMDEVSKIEQVSNITPVPERGIYVEQNHAGVVTLVLGLKPDMAILYKDPTRPSRVLACKSVPDEVMAATRSLFDARVRQARGLVGEERTMIGNRIQRLDQMLDFLGRQDIVGAMRKVNMLPGVIDRVTPN